MCKIWDSTVDGCVRREKYDRLNRDTVKSWVDEVKEAFALPGNLFTVCVGN